ncbi:hypothetical protein TKK_0002314 [Trichogramma kaykai]
MKSSSTVNFAARVKEEPDGMCDNKNDNDGTKDQTSDTKNLQYLRRLQENTIHTLEEHKGINEFQPNQEIKIEFECKDQKPNVNSFLPSNINHGSYQSDHYQDMNINDNFETHSWIEIKTESIAKKKYLSDYLKTIDMNAGGIQLNEQNIKTYPSKINEGKQRIECEICFKKFSTKTTLKIHINSVHKDLKPYHCDVCDKSFTQKFNLRRHIDSVHNGRKPHNCDICGKSFAQKCVLKTHIHSVHNLINYPCHICGKTLTRKDNLKIHIDSVHNQISYRCHICGKSFTQKGSRKFHIISVYNHMFYSCNTCGKSFSQKGYLNAHINSEHAVVNMM